MPLLSGLRLERARASKQYRDGTFHNTSGARPQMQLKGNALGMMGEFFFGGRDRTPTPVRASLG